MNFLMIPSYFSFEILAKRDCIAPSDAKGSNSYQVFIKIIIQVINNELAVRDLKV